MANMPCQTFNKAVKTINQPPLGAEKQKPGAKTVTARSQRGAASTAPRAKINITKQLNFAEMPCNAMLQLVRMVIAVFPFVHSPNLGGDPYVVWAKGHMYRGDKTFEEMTEEERASTQACFPHRPQSDKEWWSRWHHRNVRKKTVKGPWIKNRKEADWSKDNSYTATMANAMRVEFQAQIAKTDDPTEKARLKEMFEKEQEFFRLTTLGIETPMDLPYLYAHGGSFNLTVEFAFLPGTGAIPYKKRPVDPEVAPKWLWSFQVPVLNEHGEVTETLDFWHYNDAKKLIEQQTAEGKYRYDKRFPSFRGIPLVTNTFPKHPEAAADAEPKQFQVFFKTRMGLDTGKMNEKVEEREHLNKEAKRVLLLEGYKTEKEQQKQLDEAVLRMVKKVLFHWTHKVCYKDDITGIKAEFGVKYIYSQFYACQLALQTASKAQLASGTVLTTPENPGSLVWRLEKNEKGQWIARLPRVEKDLQKSLSKFKAQQVAPPKQGADAPTPQEAQEAPEEDEVAHGGSKSGQFAALKEVDCSKVTASAAPKPTQEPMKGFKAAADRGHEANPEGPAASPAPKKMTNAEKKAAKKARKKAEKMASTPCRNGGECRHAKCGFLHPPEADSEQKRKANKAAHEAKKAAKKAAEKAANEAVSIEIEFDIPEDEEDVAGEDVAGPAEEQVQERKPATEAQLKEEREKMRAEMQAEMEAQMKAEIEAEREKMREAIRQEVMAEEAERQKKTREHQEKVKLGGFSEGFEMKFATRRPAPAPAPAPKPVNPTVPRLTLSKGLDGAPMRLGPSMRLGRKMLGADKSSKA
ncbi:MAG: hypothetical protein CL678_08440 [Bdellovibrionaceae bacterium]|nr:hypothetical protein [Pseudobdellovibrionaceae bacterium]